MATPVPDYTLDDLLFNLKKDPFTLNRFYQYAEQQQCAELLDFWVSINDYLNMFQSDHPRSSYSMKYDFDDAPGDSVTRVASSGTLEGDLKRAAEAQCLIVKTYLEEDSPLEVNISDKQRRKCVERVSEDKPVDDLFDEAMKECEKLIKLNLFEKFMKAATKSLNNKSAAMRARPPPPRPTSVVVKSSGARPPSGPPPEEDVPPPKAVTRVEDLKI